MLIGKKLFVYSDGNKQLNKIDLRLEQIELEKNTLVNEQMELTKKIKLLREQPKDEEIIIEIALAEQRIIIINKDLERLEPKWMEENLELLQKKMELEITIDEIKRYFPELIWKEYYRIKENVDNPVVEVKHQMCTGCFIPLSKSDLDKWRRGKELIKCDVCGRILA